MNWKEKLKGKLSKDLEKEIDVFETQIGLRKQGKLDDKIFTETRLRRGVYGQRYDQGQRHDGVRTQTLEYPSGELTKGVNNPWDHPGMERIKIPFGRVSPEQLEVLADLSEEYSDSILHVTTRQDFQLHYVHIDDTPLIMRRLAAVGITTREACGNTVRNVTGCPLAGVCHSEAFDVSPYASALARFLLGHKDAQDFGRKFKVAFSGCAAEACGLAIMHDIGLVAKMRGEKRGFEFYVGGGLGAVPHPAVLFDEFIPEEEILPLSQAISRVFARLGEKKNRARARLKFLVAKLGIDEFRRIVREERKGLPEDPRWTSFLDERNEFEETPRGDASPLNGAPKPEGFDAWQESNTYAQRQEGYYVATVSLPLGDFTAAQARSVADLAREFSTEPLRVTVEQNIILRWVRGADLPALYGKLKAVGLGEPGAGSIVDITACPGTDTCKLGIASSRGLARELRTRLAARSGVDPAVRDLKVKVSGCFNSCGQHHVADIGFYGVTRKHHGYSVPFFQLVLGGQWQENAGSFGLATLAIPSKYVPEALNRLTDRYAAERRKDEKFKDFVQRVGKAAVKSWVEDLTVVPSHERAPEVFSDWGDPREFTISDMGIGECAGEVVSSVEFDLSAAEREVFEAQVALDDGDENRSATLALQSMVTAARGLVKTQYLDVSDEPGIVLKEFRARFFDTKVFFDKYAGGKFARYLFRQAETPLKDAASPQETHRRVEEAQLFIEAAYSCSQRLSG